MYSNCEILEENEDKELGRSSIYRRAAIGYQCNNLGCPSGMEKALVPFEGATSAKTCKKMDDWNVGDGFIGTSLGLFEWKKCADVNQQCECHSGEIRIGSRVENDWIYQRLPHKLQQMVTPCVINSFVNGEKVNTPWGKMEEVECQCATIHLNGLPCKEENNLSLRLNLVNSNCFKMDATKNEACPFIESSTESNALIRDIKISDPLCGGCSSERGICIRPSVENDWWECRDRCKMTEGCEIFNFIPLPWFEKKKDSHHRCPQNELVGIDTSFEECASMCRNIQDCIIFLYPHAGSQSRLQGNADDINGIWEFGERTLIIENAGNSSTMEQSFVFKKDLDRPDSYIWYRAVWLDNNEWEIDIQYDTQYNFEYIPSQDKIVMSWKFRNGTQSRTLTRFSSPSATGKNGCYIQRGNHDSCNEPNGDYVRYDHFERMHDSSRGICHLTVAKGVKKVESKFQAHSGAVTPIIFPSNRMGYFTPFMETPTIEDSAIACRNRCLNTVECDYFNFWGQQEDFIRTKEHYCDEDFQLYQCSNDEICSDTQNWGTVAHCLKLCRKHDNCNFFEFLRDTKRCRIYENCTLAKGTGTENTKLVFRRVDVKNDFNKSIQGTCRLSKHEQDTRFQPQEYVFSGPISTCSKYNSIILADSDWKKCAYADSMCYCYGTVRLGWDESRNGSSCVYAKSNGIGDCDAIWLYKEAPPDGKVMCTKDNFLADVESVTSRVMTSENFRCECNNRHIKTATPTLRSVGESESIQVELVNEEYSSPRQHYCNENSTESQCSSNTVEAGRMKVLVTEARTLEECFKACRRRNYIEKKMSCVLVSFNSLTKKCGISGDIFENATSEKEGEVVYRVTQSRNWQECSSQEGDLCRCSGVVRYGVEGNWRYKSAPPDAVIECSGNVFGDQRRDTLNMNKCYCDAPTMNIRSHDWVFCANNGDFCECSGEKVRFGQPLDSWSILKLGVKANGFTLASGGILCDATLFDIEDAEDKWCECYQNRGSFYGGLGRIEEKHYLIVPKEERRLVIESFQHSDSKSSNDEGFVNCPDGWEWTFPIFKTESCYNLEIESDSSIENIADCATRCSSSSDSGSGSNSILLLAAIRSMIVVSS
eukprot:g911.t1